MKNFFFILENEDMTENSGDSGFTEFSSNNMDPQKSDETKPEMRTEPPHGSDGEKKICEKSTSVTTCVQAQQSSSNNFTSDDDTDEDDDDYNDSDGAKPDILQWVR